MHQTCDQNFLLICQAEKKTMNAEIKVIILLLTPKRYPDTIKVRIRRCMFNVSSIAAEKYGRTGKFPVIVDLLLNSQ